MADDSASPFIEIKIHLPGFTLDIRLALTAAALVRIFRRIMGLPPVPTPPDPLEPPGALEPREAPAHRPARVDAVHAAQKLQDVLVGADVRGRPVARALGRDDARNGGAEGAPLALAEHAARRRGGRPGEERRRNGRRQRAGRPGAARAVEEVASRVSAVSGVH